MKIMLTLESAEAAAAASGLAAYHSHVCKHYKQAGVPDFMWRPTVEHVQVQESAHAAILYALRGQGFVMRDQDLTPLDFDEIKRTK